MGSSTATIPAIVSVSATPPVIFPNHDLSSRWVRFVRGAYSGVRNSSADAFVSGLIPFFTEFGAVSYASALVIRGKVHPLESPNLNPTVLTENQRQQRCVVLIQGDGSFPDLFADIIAELNKECPNTPVFTVQLVEGVVETQENLQRLYDLVTAIWNRYTRDGVVDCPGIVLVGHSGGANIIPQLVEALPAEYRAHMSCIKIAGTFRTALAASNFLTICPDTSECWCEDDVFEGIGSFLPSAISIPSGHVGSLFHPTVIAHVIKVVNNQQTRVTV
jgi:hypothetical protein